MAAGTGRRSGGRPATSAGIYDYLIGGKSYTPADARAAKDMLKVRPHIQANMLANRRLLKRVVRELAGSCGIRQFLDVGTGLPTMENTHDVAQAVAPESRIVYVDNDPIVITDARGLLISSPEGAAGYVQADLTDPGYILTEAAETLDMSRPMAVILLGILQFVPDERDPYGAVGTFVTAMAPGSYLVISHPARDIFADESQPGARVYENKTGVGVTYRTKEQVAGFFTRLDLLEPGIVPVNHWRPDDQEHPAANVGTWGAVGRKNTQ